MKSPTRPASGHIPPFSRLALRAASLLAAIAVALSMIGIAPATAHATTRLGTAGYGLKTIPGWSEYDGEEYIGVMKILDGYPLFCIEQGTVYDADNFDATYSSGWSDATDYDAVLAAYLIKTATDRGLATDDYTMASIAYAIHDHLDRGTVMSNGMKGWEYMKSVKPTVMDPSVTWDDLATHAAELWATARANMGVSVSGSAKYLEGLGTGSFTASAATADGNAPASAQIKLTITGPAAWDEEQAYEAHLSDDGKTLISNYNGKARTFTWHATGSGQVTVTNSLNQAQSQTNSPNGYQSLIRYKSNKAITYITEPFPVSAKADLTLVKASANTDYTSRNGAYTLKGVEYTAYADEALTEPLGTLVVQDETGATNTLEIKLGSSSTVYVKETKTSTGYQLNGKVRAVELKAGDSVTLTMDGDYANTPLDDPVNVLVQKAICTSDTAGTLQGDVTSLEGIRFRIDYYKNVYASQNEAEQHTPDASAVFATDANGYLRFQKATPVDGTSWSYQDGYGLNTFPLGTAVITELSTVPGLVVSSSRKAFTITDDGSHENAIITTIGTWDAQATDAEAGAYANCIITGGVRVAKADADWHTASAQGDGTLQGIAYRIVNRSANPVTVNNKTYQPGDTVATLTTGADGTASTSADLLPYGTYEIIEDTANDSYRHAAWSRTFTIREQGQMAGFTATGSWNEDPVKRGGIIVGKKDRETGQYTALGEASLAGATFSVVNRSANPVRVNGKDYQPGDTVMSITAQTMNVDGKQVVAAQTGVVLPYGTYEVRETGTGTGYLYDKASKAYSQTVQIREQGQIIDLAYDEADAVGNQAIREDFHFTKKAEDTMERMARVAFKVTSQTTGESHVLVSDENGTVSTGQVAHTMNTNANDPASPNSNHAISVDKDGTWVVKDASLLDPDAGTWFTGLDPERVTWASAASYVVDGTTVFVDDTLRAMPYDTYTVEELRSDANQGYALVAFTVTLHRYTANPDGPGIDLDYGTIDDRKIEIATRLLYGDGMATIPQATVGLEDTVTWTNLTAGDYTAQGTLHAFSQDGTDLGIVATGSTGFTASGQWGTLTVPLTVDGANLPAGTVKLVAYETILDASGQIVAIHEDPDDENQTVRPATIGTTLMGDIDHEANASAQTVTLIDTVKYTGLAVAREHTLTGRLVDHATGEPLLDADGQEVTATTRFTAATADGTVDVAFEFTPSDTLPGMSVTAFETLSIGSLVYAAHEDLDDMAQTVTFPAIETQAADAFDGDQELGAGEPQDIIDTVTYANLVPGNEYTVCGTLHVQHEDEDGLVVDDGELVDADGQPATACTTFTPETADGTVDVAFTGVDVSAYAGRTIVAFEQLDRDGILLAVHADIADERQSVTSMDASTMLMTSQQTHAIQFTDDVIADLDLVDTVSYHNATIGHEYTVTGLLRQAIEDEDGTIVDLGPLTGTDGQDVTGTATFTAETADGTVDVAFSANIDPGDVAGTRIVAFERVMHGDQVVAIHEDIADEAQAIMVIDLATHATDHASGTRQATGGTLFSVDDLVDLDNLPAGTYRLHATIHERGTDEDGETVDNGIVVDQDGQDVGGMLEFTWEGGSGQVSVPIDATLADGAYEGTTLVAYETLCETIPADDTGTEDGEEEAVEPPCVPIGSHEDITDDGQSVERGRIGTTLMGEDGQDTVEQGDQVTLVDTIAYGHLIPGLEYQAVGTLVDALGEPLHDKDGNEATTTVAFTPEAADGTIDVAFTVDLTGLVEGASVIAFERVYLDGQLVALHEDLDDENQTVWTTRPATPGTVDLVTAAGTYAPLLAMLAAIGALAATLEWNRRRN